MVVPYERGADFCLFMKREGDSKSSESREISPERGGELTHRVVMNTSSRLKCRATWTNYRIWLIDIPAINRELIYAFAPTLSTFVSCPVWAHVHTITQINVFAILNT